MEPLLIAGHKILPGETKRIEIPMVRLYTDTTMSIPVFVKRGKRNGPTLFLSAAIHGDELNGIEIINRIINSKSIQALKGTLIAVPMVNVYGVLNQSRYLPDRRDLNRSFPGSKRGSLAARMAHTFLTEIVSKADYGIDFHTGAIHRSNLPQIRANLDDPETLDLAKAFGLPVLLNSNLLDGSLRQCAADLGTKILLYEAGEALRFDELAIRAGVKGTTKVMRHLGMLNKSKAKTNSIIEPIIARQSGWIRANESGFVMHHKQLGDFVSKDEALATISDPYGQKLDDVLSNADGIIIGKQNIPLVQEGEAMYHVAYFKEPDDVVENLEIMNEELLPEDYT
ncbi:succinylglutamate desuccinylase/aspartoacylase family protein [Bermanella sp. WJH001]|uniref:succinylglutamate desuccinylase/aspartoacylase family protein n=1 Tax=Bermanella sp. WJH001 TaxID=3048005 RepID=UPI0024BE4EED|nr:succinylglutamate desuccinylase/aspartoacylase family protein [Bermanella sp. WJH001]MDJ1537615.1 succinylglutamate desuccinylase/aspartoacylase family protein [Bermanella sp. WJH001]